MWRQRENQTALLAALKGVESTLVVGSDGWIAVFHTITLSLIRPALQCRLASLSNGAQQLRAVMARERRPLRLFHFFYQAYMHVAHSRTQLYPHRIGKYIAALIPCKQLRMWSPQKLSTSSSYQLSSYFTRLHSQKKSACWHMKIDNLFSLSISIKQSHSHSSAVSLLATRFNVTVPIA